MRAMSRRTSLTRLGFSSWLVAAWKRRLNASRFRLPSCSSSWSSVLGRKSVALVIVSTPQVRRVAEARHDLGLDRQLHRRTLERFRRERAGNAVQLEQDAAGLDAGHP